MVLLLLEHVNVSYTKKSSSFFISLSLWRKMYKKIARGLFPPLQTSNQSSKINYAIAGKNKELLNYGTMETEGRLEAYKGSKDAPVHHYPRNVFSSQQDPSAVCMAMCPSHVGSCIIEEDGLGLSLLLCSSSGSGTSVYSNLTPNTRATGSRDSSEMASSLRRGRHHLLLKSDTSCARAAPQNVC